MGEDELRDRSLLAVAVEDGRLALPQAIADRGWDAFLVHDLERPRRGEARDVLVLERLVWRESEEAARGGVEIAHAPVRISDADDIGRRLDDPAQGIRSVARPGWNRRFGMNSCGRLMRDALLLGQRAATSFGSEADEEHT